MGIDYRMVAAVYLGGIPKERLYREHFGVSAEVTAATWDWLVDHTLPTKAKPHHLLWLFYWWKANPLQGPCCEFFGVDTKTFIKWRDLMEVAVGNLPVIDWNDRFDNFRPGNHATITVDCTDMPIWETYPFHPDLYSYKLNGPGLRYEVGVCIATGLIVWFNGPYKPRSWVDLSIFRHRMMQQLLPDEWVVGDGGYREGFHYVIPKRAGPQWLQEMTSMATARHETINSRLKIWAILRNHYRYGQGLDDRIRRHERTANAIANVTNIWMMESPPFQLEGYNDSGCLQYLN